MKLLNAFSLQMIKPGQTVVTQAITTEKAIQFAGDGLESCIGHADTANVLSSILGVAVDHNRVNVELLPGQSALVAQISGGRLPEGCTTLPEGVVIDFIMVTIYR